MDGEGCLWLWRGERAEHLGPVERAGDLVPDELARDYARLLSAWRDAFDPREEQEHAHDTSRGREFR